MKVKPSRMAFVIIAVLFLSIIALGVITAAQEQQIRTLQGNQNYILYQLKQLQKPH